MASNRYVQAHLISQLNHIPTRGLGWRFFLQFSQQLLGIFLSSASYLCYNLSYRLSLICLCLCMLTTIVSLMMGGQLWRVLPSVRLPTLILLLMFKLLFFHMRQFSPCPLVRTRPLLRHGRLQTLVDLLTRPSFGKVNKSVTYVAVMSPDMLAIAFHFSPLN